MPGSQVMIALPNAFRSVPACVGGAHVKYEGDDGRGPGGAGEDKQEITRNHKKTRFSRDA